MSNKKYNISRLFLRFYDFRKTHILTKEGVGRVVGRGLQKTVEGVSWGLDPAGTAARKTIKVTAEASESIHKAIKNMQNMVRDIDAKYNGCCPNLKGCQ